MATQQQYDQLIAAFEDGGYNTAAEMRAVLGVMASDIIALRSGGTPSVPRFGAGLPANSLGKNYDTYTDTNTGRVYQRLNGVYEFQYIAKGEDGGKPVAGVDYQAPKSGEDGNDGNRIHDKNYAPRAADNTSIGGQANLEGDQWFYTISLSSYERYSFIGGQWTLVFRKAEGTTVTPPAATDTTAPNLTFTAPASGAIVNPGQQLTLTSIATDNVAVTQVVYLNGTTGAMLGTANKNGNTYTLPFVVPQALGALTLQAQASDAAGNVQVASVTLTVQAATLPKLSTPTGYQASATSANTISTALSAVANASAYVFELATDSGFSQNVQAATQSGTTKAWSGLTANTTYYTRVKAQASGYQDSDYATSTATTQAGAATLAAGLTLPNGNSTVVGTAIPYQATANGGTAPYTQKVVAENTATGVPTTIYEGNGATYSSSWTPSAAGSFALTNTVTDAAGTSKISAVRSVTVNTAGVETTNYRMFTFDGSTTNMASRHWLAGTSTTNYTKEIPYSYTPPAGTMLSDACLWNANGMVYGAHSGYVSGPDYFSNSLVIFRAYVSADLTKTTVFEVVHKIDMSVAGRIPAGIGGYSGIGPSPIVSSPEYVARPNGRVGLIFMYQPNGIMTSNSYILYIESTDATCTSWGNAALLSGTAMPYDNGGGNIAGSYIDPAYFYYNDKHMLLLRCFTTGNGESTGIGQRVVSSANLLGPYNTVESDLRTLTNGGTNTYVNRRMEGQWMEVLPSGGLRWHTDDYGAGGMLYADSPTGSLSPTAFGAFQVVGKPSTAGYTLRHATPVLVTTFSDNVLTPVTPPTGTPTFSLRTWPIAADGSTFGYEVTTPVAPATAIKIPVQISKTASTVIGSVDVPANQVRVAGTGTSERGPNSYTNTQTLLPSTTAGAVGVYNLGTASSSFTVLGTQAEKTGPPVVTLLLGEKTLEADRVSFPALFSVDRILTQPLRVYTNVDKGGIVEQVFNDIAVGKSSEAFYGYSERRAATYTNAQALVANAAYSTGSPSGGSFEVPGLGGSTPPPPTNGVRLEMPVSGMTFTPALNAANSYQVVSDNPTKYSGGSMVYMAPFLDGRIDNMPAFTGDSIRFLSVLFGGNQVAFDVVIDGVRRTVDYGHQSTADQPFGVRYEITGLGSGVHNWHIESKADYKTPTFLDVVEVEAWA